MRSSSQEGAGLDTQLGGVANEIQGVNAITIVHDLEMNMRPGSATRRSEQGDGLVLLDHLADRHQVGAIVRIAGDITVAMADLDQVAIAPALARPGHHARRHCTDRLAGSAGEVETIVFGDVRKFGSSQTIIMNIM